MLNVGKKLEFYMTASWFEVDKKGLSKLAERFPLGRLAAELVQNALDEDISFVKVELHPVAGERGVVQIKVEDDSPEGFKRLSDAYTLFAESYKKTDPTKAGRFNLGEKLVLSRCRAASVQTTTGRIAFGEKGRENYSEARERLAHGSIFLGELKANSEEREDAVEFLRRLIVRPGVRFYLNGNILSERTPIRSFEASLGTVIADAEGVLRPAIRKTAVELYEVLPGEDPHIHELGIPVVESGLPWHVNIHQKIPLNTDRDNVLPRWAKTLNVEVLNRTSDLINVEQSNRGWVKQAAADPSADDVAVRKVLELRFGDKRVAYDPSDPEANNAAAANGYTVIGGGALSKGEWENAKRAEAVSPAGQVFPSPKPYSQYGKPVDVVPESEWTPGIRNVVRYSEFIARKLMGVSITVKVVRTHNNFAACYGDRSLDFNLLRLGHKFFDNGITEDVDDLLLHELGHEYSPNHLSEDYYKALTRLGAKLKKLALETPEEFKRF
jgi:hypothetical protein